MVLVTKLNVALPLLEFAVTSIVEILSQPRYEYKDQTLQSIIFNNTVITFLWDKS